MKLTIIALAALTAGCLMATDQSVISIESRDLGCSTDAGTAMFYAQSWSFDASNLPESPNTKGSRASLFKITGLTITKSFDDCSTALFAALTSAKTLSSFTLTQTDATGKVRELVVELDDVTVSTYHAGGTLATGEPAETISLLFSKIIITNPRTNSQTVWDSKRGAP